MSPVDGRPDGKPDGKPDDGQLLSQFATERSEAAFEELVQRHGRMVFGVCVRLLDDTHDAEDAFQATFLVLARGAAKLRKSDSVASWLYGVALRVGRNAKRLCAKRREHERRVAEMTRTESEAAWPDLGPLLDEELGRLPEKLRAPVVLCYLQNKSTAEAAEELGWTHGALRGRLAKARDLLRGRLSRRGIAVGAALLALLISENTSAAAVPPACIALTVQAATAVFVGGALASAGVSGKAALLAQEAIKGMFWAKIKMAASVVLVSASLLLGTALVARGLSSGEEPAPAAAQDTPVVEVAALHEAAPHPMERSPTAQETDAKVEPPEPSGVPEAKRGGRAEVKLKEQLAVGDLPEAVLQSLLAFRPGAVVGEVKRKTKGQRTVYEVDLEVEGKEVEVELGPDGTIRRTKEEIDVTEVPQAVADAVARLYPQVAVKEAEKETQGDRTVFEVVLEIDGEEFDVKLTPEGEVIEDEGADEQRNEQDADDGDEPTESTEGDDAKPPEGAGAEVF